MKQTISAHFDGKVLIPDEPVQLPIGKPLTVQVRLAKSGSPTKYDKGRTIIGIGRFRSGIPDLGSNKKHLKGFGR